MARGDGRGVWQLPCDIALPCARENTLLLEDAQALVANGCKVVGEGANMPTTIEATTYFQENGVALCPVRLPTPAACSCPAWR